MEMTTVFGLLLGIGGILLGNLIEGGHLASLVQGAAAVIVLSGTAGATIVSSRKRDLSLAWNLTKQAFVGNDQVAQRQTAEIFSQLLECARMARKDSILTIETKIDSMDNRFLQNVLRAVIDGIDSKILREIFEHEIDLEEQNLLGGARVWADAGGFAPTVGIIGAVLGLIHVMSNLADTSKLGSGIAVAFVATVYGVGFANLVFLPIGNKIKRKIADEMRLRQMILEGGLAIQAGLSPMMVEIKLRPFLEQDSA